MDVEGCGRHPQQSTGMEARYLVVSLANLKFKLHFNPILSEQQKEQVIEITLLASSTLPNPFCNTTHVYG